VFAAASFFPLPWGLGAVLMLGALVPCWRPRAARAGAAEPGTGR